MVQQLHAIDLEPGLRPLEFLLSEANFHRSRQNVIFGMGTRILPGMLVGMLTIDAAPVVAPVAGLVGNGVFTLASPAVGAGVQSGAYTVEMTGGSFAVSAPVFTGTGNGVLTKATPAFGAGVRAGVWQVVCYETAANGGSFVVIDPSGGEVEFVTVAQPSTGPLRFTIADGATDFVIDDAFELTVTAAVAADGLSTFKVTAPDGSSLPTGAVGTAYAGPIKFTIADGATNFVAGDKFTVTVGVGANTYGVWDPDGADGSQTIAGIAGYGYRTDLGPCDGLLFVRDCEVKGPFLIWGDDSDHITADARAAAEATLASQGIIVRW